MGAIVTFTNLKYADYISFVARVRTMQRQWLPSHTKLFKQIHIPLPLLDSQQRLSTQKIVS